MIKAALISLLFLSFAACNNAPAPNRSDSPPYSVITAKADETAGSFVIEIRLNGQPSQSDVKSIAESIITDRKRSYSTITVRSFLEDATAGSAPYAVSKLERESVTHQFNTPRTLPQKIPTH